MNNNFIIKKYILVIIVLIELLTSPVLLYSQTREIDITIHICGASESKISLLSLSGTKLFKSIAEAQGIKNGEVAKFYLPKENLPGEFILRFNYKDKKESTFYPCEKNIFISDQDLEFWINPINCNNPDSSWFQQGERENTAYALFKKENNQQKEKLELLQQFLLKYDDTKSKFFKQGIKEHKQRRQTYNRWLDTRVKEDKTLFVSSIFRFQYLPEINWEGSKKDRLISMIHNYFEGIDLTDPIITKTTQFNELMNGYVNLYGQMATTVTLRDSLISAAAKTAIEKAKQGHPLVYGWMVDYFYRGFESNNIPEGMKVLEPYLKDPNCLTSKRMEIERRLKGMETLVKGSKAPNILLKDANGDMFELNNYETFSKYILLLFWSAECSHCKETIDVLYPWQSQPEILEKISVLAISLDETVTEVQTWEQKIKDLVGWKHIRAVEGIRSKVASDYFVLATPVMILLDGKTKQIISLPTTFTQLRTELL